MVQISNIIWVSWENQRRSIELAKSFNAHLHILNTPLDTVSIPLIKYLLLCAKTLLLLINTKPKIVFAQNPSIILASLICVFKGIFHYNAIIDRHSNFKFHKTRGLKWRIFHIISKYSVRKADLTLVTNRYLADLVKSWGGRSFVLQDKLPELPFKKKILLEGKKNVVFITGFHEDEPIEEMIYAFEYLDKDWIGYFTGNYKPFFRKKNITNLPHNIRLTGFLPEEKYQSLLHSADLLVVLTKQEYTLTCGAYEGISLNKPLILSDTVTIRDYFKKGVIYTKPGSSSIAKSIRKGIAELDVLKRDCLEFKHTLISDWNDKFDELQNKIYNEDELIF